MPLPKSFFFSQATWILLRQKWLSIQFRVITGFLWSLCFFLILALLRVLVPVQIKFILQYVFIFLLLNRIIWKPNGHFEQQYYFFLMATTCVLCLSFLRENSERGQHLSVHKNVFFYLLITHKTVQQSSISKLSFCHILPVNYIYNSLYVWGGGGGWCRNWTSREIYFVSHVVSK